MIHMSAEIARNFWLTGIKWITGMVILMYSKRGKFSNRYIVDDVNF